MKKCASMIAAVIGVTAIWSVAGLADTTVPSGGSVPVTSSVQAIANSAPPADLPEGVTAEMMSQGEELFYKNCRRCHGMRGTAGVPLKGNENIADAYFLTSMIINGRGYMPALGEHLSDEQIALIGTFARNSWGNAYGVVTPEDVKDMR